MWKSQKQDFHIDLQKACELFAPFPQAAAINNKPRGGPNQTIKVDQIKWTKPPRFV